MFETINDERQQAGLDLLQADELLASIARAHAQDMVDRNYMSHTTPEGKTFDDRLQENGLDPQWKGENFYGTGGTLEEAVQIAMQWFMDDPPHRKNILHAEYRRVGVGAAENEWGGYTFVTDFTE